MAEMKDYKALSAHMKCMSEKKKRRIEMIKMKKKKKWKKRKQKELCSKTGNGSNKKKAVKRNPSVGSVNPLLKKKKWKILIED